MKAAFQTAYGGPEVVTLRDTPKPALKDNEVLVRIVATTVTSGDARLRAFRVPAAFWLPARLFLGVSRPRKAVLGSEFAGTVEATGKNARRFKPGDRVFGMHLYDVHAEYKAVPEMAAICAMPEGLDFAEAAALPFGALTALYFLKRAGVTAGQTVLVNGASGAVGCAAVQLARHFGARVTAVTSAANAELVRGLGAEAVVDYRATDFSRAGQRYDMIMDTVGTVSMEQFRRASTAEGQLLAVDGGGGMFLRAAWQNLFGRRRIIVGMASEKREDLEVVRDLAASGTLRAVIDRRVPLAGIAEAHRLVDSGRKRGAVVVEVTEPALLTTAAPVETTGAAAS